VAEQVFESRPELRSRFPQCPQRSCADLIRFVTDRPGHDRRYAIDCAKIERALGFSQQVTLLAGLRATFTWFVDNPTWWQPLLRR